MTIDLSKEEAQQLLNLLDLAVKAGGLNVASIAMPLAIKLNAAATAEESSK